MPDDIVIHEVVSVAEDFHARYNAIARSYRYYLLMDKVYPALLRQKVAWYYANLDIDKMRLAGQYLIGEQDFASFRSSQCHSKSSMRHVMAFTIERHHHLIVFEIEANAFLHHMVRNIAGVLMKIGAGSKDPEWMKEVLQAKNRRVAAETASPEGLYLIHVRYPDPYIFPPPEPFFLI